jgi:hypothetical protein
MAPINRLSTELVIEICTHLEPADLLALRLASRDISAKCFDPLADRFFASLQLLVTSDNLAFLKEVADHPVLRARVRELWLTPALFEGKYDLSIERYFGNRPILLSSSPNFADRRKVLHAQHAAYRAAVTDHLNIAMTPVLQRALHDAFERFPNLKSVGWKHQRYSCPDDHVLQCRRWKALREATGRDPAMPWLTSQLLKPNNPPVRARVLSAMLMALATAGKKIHSLDTCGGSCNDDTGLILGDSGLADTQWDSALCNLADLKALHLCIRDCASPPSSDKRFQSALGILTTAAPTIETLTFSLCGVLDEGHFEWTAARVRFSNLSRLLLWGIETSPQCLKQFLLSASPTLRWFSFWSVGLSIPEDQHTSAEDAESAGRQAWREMWEFFRDNMSLEYLEFSRLHESFNPIPVVDRLHGPLGSHPLVRATDVALWDETDVALFDATQAEVSFCEWIDQVDFDMR